MNTDVLVVGAGPTGLALATTLARAGVSTVLAEQRATGHGTSRAAVIHAHTLEVLDGLGVVGTMLREGIKLHRFSIRDRDEVLARMRFDDLPSKFTHLLMIPQDRTEAILGQALQQAGGTVSWSSTVTSITEAGGGVEAVLSTPEGTRSLRARYAVGADGMNSLVRQTAGIGFAGESYEDSFILADVEMQWHYGRDEVMLFFSPAGLVVVAPLPGGRFRIVATLENAPEVPDVPDIQALLDARGPSRQRSLVTRVHWGSRFRLHHRVADRYRTGRLFLIGDAAHVHSPAGGQGMNTGLVDACVLGRMLVEVLSGRQADVYLDRYEALRRPAAQQVLQLAGRLTGMATVKSAPQRFLRNLALRTMNLLPPARRRLEMNLSGLSRRAASVLP